MAGKIEVVTGCMYSGKSVIMRQLLENANEKFEVVVPKYDEGEELNLDEDEIIKVDLEYDNADEIIDRIDDDTNVVGLDKVNLYADVANEICRKLLHDDYHVIVSGLDMDFRGAPFPPMDDLLCVADDVIKTKTDCYECGDKATLTQRIINGRPARYDDSIVLFGGEEDYYPVCRDCHQIGGGEE